MLKMKVIFKKIFLSIVCILIIFNNDIYAIEVSDNDGSAFITKAEFDSLKNNFQSQLDAYNTGIDSKIDGAIAAYLSGININKDPINMFDKFKSSLGTDRLIFYPGLNGGTSSYTNYLDWTFVRHYTYDAINNLNRKYKSVGQSNVEYLQSAIYYGSNYSGRMDENVKYVQITRSGAGDLYSSDFPTAWTNGSGTGVAYSKYNQSLSAAKIVRNGSGSGWWFKKYNSQYWTLGYYCDSMYPMISIEANFHTYADRKALDNKLKDNGLGDTTLLTKTHPTYLKWGSDEDGTIATDDSTTAKSLYSKITQNFYKSYDVNQDYSNVQLATWTPSYVIYGAHDDSAIQAGSSTDVTLSQQNFYSIYYEPRETKMQTNKLSGGTLTFTEIKVTPLALDPSAKIVNSAITGIAGEPVFLGGGCPIANVVESDSNLKIKLYVGTSNPLANKIDYKISNKQFKCGNYDTAQGGKKLAEGTITYVSDTTGNTLEFEVEEEGNVWINLKNQNNSETASLLKVEIVK